MRNAQRVALQDPLSSPFRYGVFKQPPLYVRVVSIVRVIVFYQLDPNFQMRDFYSLLNETEDQKDREIVYCGAYERQGLCVMLRVSDESNYQTSVQVRV